MFETSRPIGLHTRRMVFNDRGFFLMKDSDPHVTMGGVVIGAIFVLEKIVQIVTGLRCGELWRFSD